MRRKLQAIWEILNAKSYYVCCWNADPELGKQFHNKLKVHQADGIIRKLNAEIQDELDVSDAIAETKNLINKT